MVDANRSDFETSICALPVAFIILLSAVTFACAIAVREATVAGREPWHFNIRHMLIVTTLVAVLVALATACIRYLSAAMKRDHRKTLAAILATLDRMLLDAESIIAHPA